MQDFRNVKAWELSHRFTLKIYDTTRRFPKEELFGLTSQLRRSASSIPTNIAEGCGRGSDSDFARFLQMSIGSASETEYQIILSHDLGYIDDDFETLMADISNIKKALSGLIKAVRSVR